MKPAFSFFIYIFQKWVPEWQNTETSENYIFGSDNAIGPPPPLNLSRPGDADDYGWQKQQWRQSDLCNCDKRWSAIKSSPPLQQAANNSGQSSALAFESAVDCAMSENKHMWSDLQASCLVFPFWMYFFFRVGWLGNGARKPNQSVSVLWRARLPVNVFMELWGFVF